MRQNIVQKILNPISKLFYSSPEKNLEVDRGTNLACKKALEKLGFSSQSQNLRRKDLDRIIAYYGHNRVANLLSNSVGFFKEGEIISANKAWAEQYGAFAQVRHWGRSEEYINDFVPDSSEDFALKSSGSYINWAIEQVKEREINRKLIQPEQYQSLDSLEGDSSIRRKVVALSPSAMKNPFSKQSSQLWVALDGNAESQEIKVRNLKTGLEMMVDRTMILGVVEDLSEKTIKKLAKLFPSSIRDEEIFEQGQPLSGKENQNYRLLSQKNDTVLVAERTRNNEIHFCTFELIGVDLSNKHDFGGDWESAKNDFGVRSGMIPNKPIVYMEDYQKSEENEVQNPTITKEEMEIYLKVSAKLKGEPVPVQEEKHQVEPPIQLPNETANEEELRTAEHEEMREEIHPVNEEKRQEPVEQIMLTIAEKSAIAQACLYAYENMPHLSQSMETALSSVLERFLPQEEVHQPEPVEGMVEEYDFFTEEPPPEKEEMYYYEEMEELVQ
ncbi:MAG: DUF3849 domain-containing protein [Eubacteriales bacterium]